jgi:hypothetical protein
MQTGRGQALGAEALRRARSGWRWAIGESSGPPNHPFVVAAAAAGVAAAVILLVAFLPGSGSPDAAPPRPPTGTASHLGSSTIPNVPGSARVVTPPSTIADNCSTDVSDSLRYWLWSLPRGTSTRPLVIDFPPGACYEVNEVLYLRGFTSTTFNGNGAQFHQVTPATETIGPLPKVAPYCGSKADFASGTSPSTIPIIWWFEGGCHITITGMHIFGPDTTQVVDSPNDSGIELSGVQQGLIDNTSISDVDGDFVTLTGLTEASAQPNGGTDAYPSTDITIQGDTFARSGRQGITPEYVKGVTITGNTFTGVADSDIDLEADTQGGCSCNVRVDHNTFTGLDAYVVAGLTGLSIQEFSFTDNQLTQGAQLKIQLAPDLPSSGIVISNNTVSSGSTWPWPSIGIAYSVDGDGSGQVTNVQIEGNSVPAPTEGRPFVEAGSNSANVAVISNVLTGGTSSTPLLNHGPSSNTSCGNKGGAQGPALDGAC